MIDLSKAFDKPEEGLKYIPVHYWNIRGHQVAFLRLIRDDGYTESWLMCDCDFQERSAPIILGSSNDPHACAAKKTVYTQVIEQEKQWYEHYLRDHSVKEAILHIFERSRAQEFLGLQYTSIYAQEVAELLSMQWRDVLVHIDELFTEEKLNLNGMILVPYTHRFRFPKEIQQLLRYMIEEPLGWPNGDAGDCFLHDLEKAIHEYTHYKHGKDAFGYGGNYPHVDAHILSMFGMKWVRDALTSYAIDAGKGDEKAKENFMDIYREIGLLTEQCRLIIEKLH